MDAQYLPSVTLSLDTVSTAQYFLAWHAAMGLASFRRRVAVGSHDIFLVAHTIDLAGAKGTCYDSRLHFFALSWFPNATRFRQHRTLFYLRYQLSPVFVPEHPRIKKTTAPLDIVDCCLVTFACQPGCMGISFHSGIDPSISTLADIGCSTSTEKNAFSQNLSRLVAFSHPASIGVGLADHFNLHPIHLLCHRPRQGIRQQLWAGYYAFDLIYFE